MDLPYMVKSFQNEQMIKSNYQWNKEKNKNFAAILNFIFIEKELN